MDTSEIYVKMNEKAVEIQKIAPDMLGHQWRKDNIHILNGNYYWMEISLKGISERIWLPRQDQLQEMVLKIGNHPWSLFWDIEDWLSKIAGDSYEYINVNKIPFTSMEQLWLAFVMSELYLRRWDGNDWIKI